MKLKGKSENLELKDKTLKENQNAWEEGLKLLNNKRSELNLENEI